MATRCLPFVLCEAVHESFERVLEFCPSDSSPGDVRARHDVVTVIPSHTIIMFLNLYAIMNSTELFGATMGPSHLLSMVMLPPETA